MKKSSNISPAVSEAEHFSPDSDARKVLDLYAAAAKSVTGIFCLTSIDKEGRVNPETFLPSEVSRMAEAAIALGRSNNVFMMPALLDRNLQKGRRGGIGDVTAVLGLVIDNDNDTGKSAIVPHGLLPSIEITTSRSPTTNTHSHYVFDRPLAVPEAKDLARLLRAKCGGDFGTADVAHVWRLPQTLNHPTKSKIARGRPKDPQKVDLTGGTFKLVDVDVFRRTLQAMPDYQFQPADTNEAAVLDADDFDDALAALPQGLREMLTRETGKQGDRSTHCHRCMQALMENGLSDKQIGIVAGRTAFAAKFVERGDLGAEIKRQRANWANAGCQLRSSHGQRDVNDGDDFWPTVLPDAFHGIAGEIANLATKNSEADPMAVLATTLVWASATFGRSRYLNIGDTSHHSRLFGALVGESSRARKGTSLDSASRIFGESERILADYATAAVPPLRVSHGPLSSGEGLINHIRDPRDSADEGGVRDKRLLCIEGEFAAVLQACQRQGNNLSSVLRNAWDGATLQPLTKTNPICATHRISAFSLTLPVTNFANCSERLILGTASQIAFCGRRSNGEDTSLFHPRWTSTMSDGSRNR